MESDLPAVEASVAFVAVVVTGAAAGAAAGGEVEDASGFVVLVGSEELGVAAVSLLAFFLRENRPFRPLLSWATASGAMV